MMKVVLDQLSFGFDTPIFEHVSASFDAGWTGLVGANGSGKTTLLRLIAGELTPTQGSVRVVPAGEVVWCRQQCREQRAELEQFALDTSKAAQRWRGLLGVTREELDRFDSLSPGERKRWQLAFCLAREPAVLLLDEPTNHLDAVAGELLQRALARFEGVGVLVSHDRALLEAVTARTARVTACRLDVYPGTYGAARAEWQAQNAAVLATRATLTRTRDRLAARADQQRRRAASAEHDRSARRRMKDKNDHDARSILSKNKAEAAGRRLARDGAALDSRRERVQHELSQLRFEKQLGADVFAHYVPWPKPLVATLRCDELRAGARQLLGPTALDLARYDKLWLGGPNGSGKTTLLQELARQNPHAFASSLYLPQAISGDERARLQRELCQLPRAARGHVLTLVAALGSDPDRLLASAAWSPGETRKVALALGLAVNAPALILDEPTNHFDLNSIERIERLLAAFPGALLLVTHDTSLGESIATRKLVIEGGALIEHAVSRESHCVRS